VKRKSRSSGEGGYFIGIGTTRDRGAGAQLGDEDEMVYDPRADATQ
jgi:hypothetical protein